MSVTVPRYGHVVVPDVAASLAGGASLTAARLQVAVQSGGGRLVAIAKIVDRTLGSVAVLVGQPEAGVAAGKRAWMRSMLGLQEPEATGAASYLIPLVASGVSGASGSTLVGLSSSLGTATSVQLTLHPSTGSTIVKTVSLAPGTSLEYKDILRELFATTLPIRGSVSVAAADGVRVYSRSLAVPVGGTTAVTAGENPVISLGSQLIVGALPGAVRPIYLDGLSQSVDPTRGSRCSVLISEGAGRQGVVTVRLYEAGNRQVPVAEKDISVPAFGTVPLETIFGALGLESDSRKKDRTNVMCAVVPKNGQALVAAVGVLQDTETGQLRSVAFQPSGGSRPSGTSLAGAVGPEPPSRRRPIRR